MNFDLTDEQKLFADQVRRFAQTHLAAGALKRAHDPRFPYDVAQLMAKQGLTGIALPERDGGQAKSDGFSAYSRCSRLRHPRSALSRIMNAV
jgi:alkylation response protein AidB-like acyl-CoA dehydrogenase